MSGVAESWALEPTGGAGEDVPGPGPELPLRTGPDLDPKGPHISPFSRVVVLNLGPTLESPGEL